MRVYFVRHGESKFNALQLRQHGRVELSEYGAKQAASVANRFKKLPVDIILSSDYTRTKQTAQIIQKIVRVPIEYTDLLREIKRPMEIEGKRIDDPEAVRIMNLIKTHEYDPDWHHSDEENFFDVRRRIVDFWNLLCLRKEERILVVTHTVVLRYLMGILLFCENFGPQEAHRVYHFFRMSNTGITVIGRDGGGNWHLVTWNDHAHLG